MSEPLPILIQSSLQIAFDFLQRSGEITDAVEAGTFLLGTINHLLMKGERRNLVLSNKAITEYKKFKAERNPDAASG